MKSEIKPLTSIRGIAALLVVIYHFHQTDNISFAPLDNLIDRGYLWVDLFFVLSGFVMAMTYGERFAKGFSWKEYRDFLAKRIARIYPLYAAVTLFISLYTLVVYGRYSDVHRPAASLKDPIEAHITNFLMIHAWGFGSSIGGPTWSISTEWAAYLLFPVLVISALYTKRLASIALALLAAGTLYYVSVTPEVSQTVRNGEFDIYHCNDLLALLRCLGGFCVGLLAYRMTRSDAFMNIMKRDAVCLGLFTFLLILMSTTLSDLWIYPFLPLVIISLYKVRGMAERIFSAKVFYILGLLSYSIYLIHQHCQVVLDQLNKRLPAWIPDPYVPWVSAAVTYPLILLLSVIAYNFIEKPGRSYLTRLLARRPA